MLMDVPARSDLPTQLADAFPLVTTDKLDEVKRFYLQTLGCKATYDLENYFQVCLTTRGGDGPQLCFMKPGCGASKVHEGGFIHSIPVPDADAVEARLREAGVPIAAGTSDKPWGWRSLNIVDPAGVVLDFFHVARQDG